MTMLANAANTEFTPTQSHFIARAVGGAATLLRKNDATDTQFGVAGHIDAGAAVVVWNPTPGAVYSFSAPAGVNVRADE